MYENACYTNTEDSCHYVYDTDYVEKCYTKYTRLVTCRVVLQGDQLNMAVFSCILEYETCSVLYTCTVSFIDKYIFTRYHKNTAIYNWSLCTTGLDFQVIFLVLDSTNNKNPI